MKRVLFIMMLSFCFLSCGGSLLNIISRPQLDPDNFYIKVDSFSNQNEIKCSWDNDDLCDKYILMRSENKEALTFEEVYAGNKVEYVDRDLRMDTMYIYRLDKVRGNLKFKGGTHFLGVSSDKIDDVYEDNDLEENAVVLSNDIQGNVYYYESFGGRVLFDEDWYKVNLSAGWKAQISITFNSGKKPFLITMPYNFEELSPSSNSLISITNDTNEDRELSFKVSIDENIALSGTSSAFYTYVLRLVSVTH